MQHDFSHVTTWVFDLDNTLYPPSDALFDQIDVLMTQYVMQALNLDEPAADKIRATYWKEYGTTLAGLMERHDLDPDPFLDAVHKIDVSHIKKNTELRDNITKLNGRKIIYTNGSKGHAENVTRALGIDDIFDGMYGVEHAGYQPKPRRAAFERVFALDGVDPTKAALFEDDVRNLEIPHAMGLKTILVGPKEDHPFIHYHTDDLTDFLSRLVA
ncbi:pyrimidine 5'-nucleotidase [Amylibacter sp. SFDW26]|uniref:pyrimidine 5'-nucleotidase n=1 Tax=Amylibacter sp. SFDW26 TaxID=2652722 RepID=UPI00126217D8|nr:pyrimidine 5'-nucleotidase [Amylibacter sp. SFDW26]KAB7615534.1 pyrimidine 5'-nucleotidase [Amylibacter sp. SFDW26]